MMITEPLNVMVIEDHLAMCRGIELLLRGEGMRIAGVASDVRQARELFERRACDVALIDIRLGAESALGIVADLLRRDPDAAIVLYTGYTDSDAGLAEAVRVGTRGFVLKSSPAQHLIDALRRVAVGGLYVDPGLSALLSEQTGVSRMPRLSSRELEILGLLADGFNGQAIADRLFLSPETVRTHVRNGALKLGARTRVQAVAMMVRNPGMRNSFVPHRD
jgi:DNA-binding NarL/FixJ family response regulator